MTVDATTVYGDDEYIDKDNGTFKMSFSKDCPVIAQNKIHPFFPSKPKIFTIYVYFHPYLPHTQTLYNHSKKFTLASLNDSVSKLLLHEPIIPNDLFLFVKLPNKIR